ncbi:hypothetical protein CkaCkLH20_08607 [Colletotrichum karsti]|uniref:beta-glucosidase n=1 Tax=Colletotrichum karsti TaxID=1095194 RepID=A0A9P6HZR6_9PEZI|nr:uncharacterized protein CkaCkLH20_08607 [Colletotrichum karsti]KAF9873873.1 hypothetical protein CkaCkLH20_08607 [Colletotrichum karsti]
MAPETSQVDVHALLAKLTREEKVSLLAAVDWWRTLTIERDGVFVPHIKATDGPNGARGESYVSGIKAACFPCGTSLGASFDRDLLYRCGKEIAIEAKSKSANLLLAPTLNVIRSPRGGRNYETYSEDPFVLGSLAAAFVNGCQSEGVAATPKHFVANDTENNRKVLTAEVDEQTLREIYMLPFQLVMKYSDPWCFMTSYNKVNGAYVSDSSRLVNDVLRGEWGFNGTVVSDWMGVYSTADSINAGVDVDLPGPTIYRGPKLLKAIDEGLVSDDTIDKSALRVLELAKRLGRFENPEEPPEQEAKNPQRDESIRQGGAQGMVLLKNDGDLLPIPKTSSVAIIGHHAQHASLGGGGSARVDSIRAVSPAAGLEAAGFKTKLSSGVPVFGALPHADPSILYDSETKTQIPDPVQIEWFNGNIIGQNLAWKERKALPEYMIKEKWPESLSKEYCTRITFDVCPKTSGDHILSVISTGPSICYINGAEVYQRPQETDLTQESFYFFKSKLERRFTHPMKAGEHYELVLESWNTDPEILNAKPLYGKMFQGSALRFHEHIDTPGRINDAVAAAKESDYAVVCVGTTNEIESEGFDRDTMNLTTAQCEQILAVAAANRRTIVVNFSGGPVDLTPFVDAVPGLIQAWFPGQECGHSLALVLSGDVNPSGRLPFSWPEKDEDNPAWGNFPCDENNVVRYEEGLDVGYRFYDRKSSPDPLFPFGYGLSYTTFDIGDLHSPKSTLRWAHDAVTVSANVKNTGNTAGSVVLQYYVAMPAAGNAYKGRQRPEKELKEFRKVSLGAGESRTMEISLDKYAFSFYEADASCWRVDVGKYKIQVGFSSVNLKASVDVEVTTGFTWTGI